MRNWVLSGLALGVVVVEGEKDSGSLITADAALEQGREVFAVPGPLDSPMSDGPHLLIQQGAKLVRSVEDILLELPQALQTPSVSQPASRRRSTEGPQPALIPAGPALSGEEARLHALLMEKGKLHLDQLAELAGFASGKLAASVTLLELKGAVRQLPGSYVEAL